ncbi:hypothetical protein D3C86_1873460 [compost metagenome]
MVNSRPAVIKLNAISISVEIPSSLAIPFAEPIGIMASFTELFIIISATITKVPSPPAIAIISG